MANPNQYLVEVFISGTSKGFVGSNGRIVEKAERAEIFLEPSQAEKLASNLNAASRTGITYVVHRNSTSKMRF